jgi:molybdate transport system substrate-binding protein
MNARRLAVACCALLLLLGACAAPAGSGEPTEQEGAASGSRVVRIAAASDLKFALDEVADLVTERHPDIRASITYGSSGTFLQQIRNGAPYDMYLSADVDYPRELVAEGAASEDDLFSYAVGRLVLWVPDGSPIDPADGLGALVDDRVRRVAIANPEHAPYGVAAVEALRSHGVYGEVKDALALGENVAQAAEFVQSGNADAGVVALSLVLSDPLRDSGRWAEVPLGSFPTLEQGGVVLARSSDVEAARAVRDVLLSTHGTDVLERYGFVLPEG